MIRKPQEANGWLDRYIGLVTDESLVEGLKRQTSETLALLTSLSEEQLNFRYAPDKWNIKEIILHLIDTERVFAYRALCFARKDKTQLPGYDENLFASNSGANNRTIQSIIEEYIVIRTASVATYSNFNDEMLDERGIANKISMSARALGFATLGHEIHHLNVMHERYLLT